MGLWVRRVGAPVAAGLAAPAVVATLAMRLWTSSPLWLDEAQGVAIARLPLPQLFEALRGDGAPPLYYLLLHAWMELFGTGDVAARSLSVVFGLAALPLLWWAGARFGGRATGVAAVGLGLCLPWMVRYSTEARMYSLVVVLVLAATLAMDRALRSGGTAAMVGLGAATGAVLLTHYWALFLFAVAAASLLVGAVLRRYVPVARDLHLGKAVAGLALGVVLFLPWLPSVLVQIRTTGAPWAEEAYVSRLALLPGDWVGAAMPGGRWLLLMVLPLLFLGVFARPQVRGVHLLGSGESSRAVTVTPGVGMLLGAVVAAVLVLALLAARVTSSGIEPRYTAVVVPFVVLLIARGIMSLPPKAAVAALVATLALGALASWDVVSVRRTQAADLGHAFGRYAAAGDVVVYCPDQLAPSVHRQLPDEVKARTASITVPGGPTAERVDWVDYERRIDQTSPAQVAAQARARAGDGAIWYVSSSRYLTHLSICNEIGGALRDLRLTGRTVVEPDITAFEHARLERFSPRSPWDTVQRRLDALGVPLPLEP